MEATEGGKKMKKILIMYTKIGPLPIILFLRISGEQPFDTFTPWKRYWAELWVINMSSRGMNNIINKKITRNISGIIK